MTYENKIIQLKQYMQTIARKYHNASDVEDAVQDCMYSMLVKKNKYSNANSTQLKNLCYTIIKHNYIDQYRLKRRGGVKVDYDVSEYIVSNTDQTDTLTKVNEIKTMVKRLNPRGKVIMQMRALGYGYKDIAQQLGIPIGTVKATIHHIRNKKLSYA